MSPLTKKLPDRHPYEVYLLGIFAVFCALDLLDVVPSPNSIQQQIPARWAWSATILIGCVLALGGLSVKRVPGRIKVTPLLCEQIGLVIVGIGMIAYGFALVLTVGGVGAFNVAYTLGFALASFKQAYNIQKFLHLVVEHQRLTKEEGS